MAFDVGALIGNAWREATGEAREARTEVRQTALTEKLLRQQQLLQSQGRQKEASDLAELMKTLSLTSDRVNATTQDNLDRSAVRGDQSFDRRTQSLVNAMPVARDTQIAIGDAKTNNALAVLRQNQAGGQQTLETLAGVGGLSDRSLDKLFNHRMQMAERMKPTGLQQAAPFIGALMLGIGALKS